jgi:hypothetical protein
LSWELSNGILFENQTSKSSSFGLFASQGDILFVQNELEQISHTRK